MKKLIALILSLTMLMALSTTAMGAWYDEAVAYATQNGLMTAVTNPNADATRGEIVDALYTLAGKPAADSAAAWANAQGILTGYGGDYHLNDSLTREQLATMLWRNAGRPTAGTPFYADSGSIGDYAKTAVAWAKDAKVMSGVGNDRFDPAANVTRATLAQILYNNRASASAYQTGPLVIARQGLFSSGGTVTKPVEGTYNPALSFMDPTLAGTTAHIDHANVFYQIPETQSGSPIVYLHGYGQSRMGWQTTPDGREGWSDIFLRYGHAAFLVDQPRRGEAGATASMTSDGLDMWGEDGKSYKPGEQAWYTHFRIGLVAPDRYEGSQFPAGAEAQNQFFRQMTPNTGSYDQALDAAALGAVMADVKTMTGQKSIYITHSQGGGVGWDTPVENVAAIVAIEPGGAPQVGSEQYKKLLDAKIPIIMYFGDYIDNGPEDIMSTGFWQGIRDGAIAFAEQYNADGGDVTVIDLPKIGMTGNSHFLFQELNNKEIADHVQAWLSERGL